MIPTRKKYQINLDLTLMHDIEINTDFRKNWVKISRGKSCWRIKKHDFGEKMDAINIVLDSEDIGRKVERITREILEEHKINVVNHINKDGA